MLWILAILVGIVAGAIALNYTRSKTKNEFVRACGAMAGFIIGDFLTYFVANHLG